MKKIFLLLSFFIFLGTNTFSQKYGHLNFGNLIAQMTETKAADSELEAYQKQLVAKGEDMARGFQEKVDKFYGEIQSGKLSPTAQQEKETTLKNEQSAIVAYEQEVVQKLDEKRKELLKPIVEKAEKAIKAVAKENGYVFIFDTSVFNALLYVEDNDDVMPLVKAKLGI